MNTKKLYIRNYIDTSEGWIQRQELYDKDKEIYCVNNLADCPEDAIIERDLFSAEEYVEAVRYGIELAKQGFDNIEFDSMDLEDEW